MWFLVALAAIAIVAVVVMTWTQRQVRHPKEYLKVKNAKECASRGKYYDAKRNNCMSADFCKNNGGTLVDNPGGTKSCEQGSITEKIKAAREGPGDCVKKGEKYWFDFSKGNCVKGRDKCKGDIIEGKCVTAADNDALNTIDNIAKKIKECNERRGSWRENTCMDIGERQGDIPTGGGAPVCKDPRQRHNATGECVCRFANEEKDSDGVCKCKNIQGIEFVKDRCVVKKCGDRAKVVNGTCGCKYKNEVLADDKVNCICDEDKGYTWNGQECVCQAQGFNFVNNKCVKA